MTSPGLGERTSVSRQYFVGILLLLSVVFLWTSSNFITQDLFANGYHKPFLVTYFNTSAFAFYLIPFAFRRYTRTCCARKQREGYQPLAEELATDDTSGDPLHDRDISSRPVDTLGPLSTEETARLALAFCFLWFIANWSVNAALDYVSVASTTILSSTSGFVTLGLGYLVGVEALTPLKVTTVLTSFLGVVLVCLSDNSKSDTSSSRPILGDVLAALSAVFYALYVLLLKVRIKEESRINMQLFFGFVGIFNIVLMIPIAGLLHLLGLEEFALPHTRNEWGAVLINMFITWSSDYLYVLAMLRTTPVVVTIGLSLTIPLAVIGDKFFGVAISGQAAVGAVLVLSSFIILGWGQK